MHKSSILLGFAMGVIVMMGVMMFMLPQQQEETHEPINGQPQQAKVIDTLEVGTFMTADQLQVKMVMVGSNDNADLVKAKVQLRDQIVEHSFWWLHKYAKDSLDISHYLIVNPVFDERTEKLIADYYTTQANYQKAQTQLEFQKMMAEQSNFMVDSILRENRKKLQTNLDN